MIYLNSTQVVLQIELVITNNELSSIDVFIYIVNIRPL